MSGDVPLPARTDVAALAQRAVSAAIAAAMNVAGIAGSPALDPRAIAIAYSSERWLRIDGSPHAAFAPLSGFFRTSDGFVRTHANYPHHRAALLRALDLPAEAGAEQLGAVLERRSAQRTADLVTAAGGLCVAVRDEAPAHDTALRRTPLVDVRRLDASAPIPLPDPSPAAPLRGVRVLDLSRVIAGPVATRTLAFLGAEVLRLDPPGLPEIPAQHLDTGHGKRSALLDLASDTGSRRWRELLSAADVVMLAYREAGLERLGITPARLAAERPGLVVVSLTAWGTPDRRGFDSLVQAESGIARIEGDADRPGVLPAQALDHSAGYLLAAAALDLLRERATSGGSRHAHTSLRRVAAELLGLPRTADPAPEPGLVDAAGYTQSFTVGGHEIVTAGPALRYPGGPTAFAAPRPWGQDEPAWA